MSLDRLDLNLLVSLDALLATRSVTAAARRMHVSQPSMSGSLARLREHFGEPLLVKTGSGMRLTPFAENLAVAVRVALEQVAAVVAMRASFDAASSRRRFRLLASEPTVVTLLSRAIRLAQQRAPGVTFEIRPTEARHVEELLQRGELDFAFVAEHLLRAGQPHALVIDDGFACVVWAGNTGVGDALSLEQYLALSHVVARYGHDRRAGYELWSAEKMGLDRHEAISCSSPVLMGPLVVGTGHIATMPAGLATLQAATLPLRILTPPAELELRRLRIVMQWGHAHNEDEGLRWFRECVVEAAASYPGSPPQANSRSSAQFHMSATTSGR